MFIFNSEEGEGEISSFHIFITSFNFHSTKKDDTINGGLAGGLRVIQKRGEVR